MAVVKGTGPSLLGENWLKHLRLDWKDVRNVDPLKSLLDKYAKVYKEEHTQGLFLYNRLLFGE